jgi:DNA invertase Pin-like site-specific DNA recombinase
VAIYCRISSDRKGDAVGVDRQEQDCKALAKRLGCEVAAIYVDNDLSASTKSRKPRPQYDEMMRLASAGQFAAILAYSNSRLTRRPREFEDLVDLHDKRGVEIHTVVSGSFDLATADGRRMARFLAGEATAEAERTSERTKRAKAKMVEDGIPLGGPRMYGYRKGNLKIKEDEAAIIREASEALLAGRSLRAVVIELNQRGVPTARSKESWSTQALKQVLLRPRNAGLISRGAADRVTTEILDKEGRWEAIVPKETLFALRALLLDPSRRTSPSSLNVKHLGSGVYLCGKCKGNVTMRTGPLPRRKGDAPDAPRRVKYLCAEGLHLTISAEPTDDFVRQVVAERVRDPRVIAALGASKNEASAAAMKALRAERDRLTRRADKLEADYYAEVLTSAAYKRLSTRVEAELAEVDARLSDGVQQAAASPIFMAADPGQAFLDAPVDIQRGVLTSVVRVRILPSGPGQKWSTDRIDITPVE